ncbi:G-alpha-domain-containing protein [Gymnopus androsaceus JB14]|uniref:G-alpha-domain-containing protein n=1 Tax=Gymnopus androsaceus JB14 TaxID=1447944 RepID=A0A6A4HGK1_9AGAR|nr:G-alpha-domain-containing protein [Gymnopus androsaceus JB14]
MDRHSETSSIFTTTSSSTVPGLGYHSGRAIRRVGSVVVNGLDAILIRRRLAQVEAVLGQGANALNAESDKLKLLYSDLFELSRPVYSLSIRTRAFSLIMGQVGGMEFEDLAATILESPLSESYDLLKEMLLCIRSQGESTKLSSVGLAAYKARLPYASSEFMSRSILCTAFLLYLGLLISLSSGSTFPRLVIDLGLLTFILESYPGILELKIFNYSWPEQHLLGVQLFLLSLSVKLDPVADVLSTTQVDRLLTAIGKILSTENRGTEQDQDDSLVPSVLTRIRLHISTYRLTRNFAVGITQNIAKPISNNESIARDHEIEQLLTRDRMMRSNEIRLLLLGTDESGKSNLLQQTKLMMNGGYNVQERESYKEIIFYNTIQSMCAILKALPVLGLLLTPQNDVHRATIFAHRMQIEVDVLPRDVADAIRSLWKDPGVKEAVRHSREFQLNDSAVYYFNNVDRISQPGYMPTDWDIIRSYVKTTGITETTFKVGDLTYRLLDVGGQRSERKKWIHSFENVTALVFFAKLTEYDQMLYEDESVNRMQETLTLFDSICNSKWFVKTTIILFLNETDIFAEKLPRSPLGEYFPDYKSGNNYDAACEYLLHRFVSLNQNTATKQIHVHYTCTTDTQQIKCVLDSIRDILFQNHLRERGLL